MGLVLVDVELLSPSSLTNSGEFVYQLPTESTATGKKWWNCMQGDDSIFSLFLRVSFHAAELHAFCQVKCSHDAPNVSDTVAYHAKHRAL